MLCKAKLYVCAWSALPSPPLSLAPMSVCHGHRPRSYDGCIVHGLMVAGLFSTAFGRAISGALYVSQSLR